MMRRENLISTLKKASSRCKILTFSSKDVLSAQKFGSLQKPFSHGIESFISGSIKVNVSQYQME